MVICYHGGFSKRRWMTNQVEDDGAWGDRLAQALNWFFRREHLGRDLPSARKPVSALDDECIGIRRNSAQ